jgi:hypothetical protein
MIIGPICRILGLISEQSDIASVDAEGFYIVGYGQRKRHQRAKEEKPSRRWVCHCNLPLSPPLQCLLEQRNGNSKPILCDLAMLYLPFPNP